MEISSALMVLLLIVILGVAGRLIANTKVWWLVPIAWLYRWPYRTRTWIEWFWRTLLIFTFFFVISSLGKGSTIGVFVGIALIAISGWFEFKTWQKIKNPEPESSKMPDTSGNAEVQNRSKTYAEIRAERDAKNSGKSKAGKFAMGALNLAAAPVLPRKKDSWLRSLIFAAIIAGIIRTFFFEAFRIPTGSMKNTLLVGDYLFVNKIGYFIESPRYIPFTTTEIPHIHLKTFGVHRGDVVVFEYPGDRDFVVPREKKVNYIKRCIGEPGDVIQIRNKQVFVNGKISSNPPESILERDTEKAGFVDPRIFPKGGQWNKDNFGPLRVPKKGDKIAVTRENLEQWEVFIEREGHHVEVMNDEVLIDSNPTKEYEVQRDYLWMMGDNRDDSEDSRFWGFAPMDNVVGSGMIIYWSWYGSLFGDPPTSGDGYDPDEVQKFHIRWDRIGNIIH